MSSRTPTTVAIVEDNPALAATLQRIIDSCDDFSCLGVWNSGEDALKKIDAFRPEVVLMDINLPGISGIETTARVKAHLPDIQIIMVTVYAEHDKIFAALKAGASGYLLKRSTPAEVREAIRDVIAGGAPMSRAIARRIVETFHEPSPPDSTEEDNLTPRENEVLELVGQGLVNKEIAAVLEISVQTVRVHVKHIYEKLHIRSRVEAAIYCRDHRGHGSQGR